MSAPAKRISSDLSARKEPLEITCGVDRTERLRMSAKYGRDVNPGSVRPTADKRPLVSVIIPTFNRAELLPRALESVIAQTFDDYEILVVDDESTDETKDVVLSYGEARIRYLRQAENAGPGAARNRGLREARGDLIAFLDSDDEWLPDKLTRQVSLFREIAPEVGLVYTGVESVFGDGTRKIDPPSRRGDVYESMLQQNVIHGGGSNVMMRRNVVATIGYFDEEFSAIEDYDYWLRITRFFEIDFVDETLIRYHDPRSVECGKPIRKSLSIRDNLDARAHFYKKHRTEMRRLGVAHQFLLETARRHLLPSCGDARGARKFVVRALLEEPTSKVVHRMLRQTCVPAGLRQFLVTAWRAVH
jgi:glycosyltransferase involved in cell wall biosynthesis